eukprot:TRINITY_DN2906_c2_g1_i1.p1 TRINITY_DN2906_c2_g1~~TRINITY_DN2906_c2_g1_i1.p1  ORF type:complete len:325 (+),score=24.90 TRINITY_DN2906_c2_g1_i1:32-976(+)
MESEIRTPGAAPQTANASSSFQRRFAAGGGAGIITKLATAPLERAKCLMQLQGMMGYVGEKAKYPNVVQTIKRVWQEEGPCALYRGCGANIIRIAPAYAFKFSLVDHFKKKVARPGQRARDLSFHQVIYASTVAGALQTAFTYPLESLRQRLYMSDSLGHSLHGSGIPHCIAKTYQQEGIRGFYRGLTVGLATGAPFVGVEMSTYELLQRRIPAEATGTERIPYHFAYGSMAGVLTQTILYPLDTIWRRMMSDGIFLTERRYTSSWHCIATTLQSEGIQGLFAGVGANATRALPAAGIQFVAYDMLKNVLSVGE